MMETIPFIQYLRPNGRKTVVEAPIPLGYEKVVEKLLEKEVRLTCEVLTTNQVVLYAGENHDGDFAMVISQNGPEVREKLIELLAKCMGHYNL